MKIGEYYLHSTRPNDYAYLLDIVMFDNEAFASIIWASDGFREKMEVVGFSPFVPSHEGKQLCSTRKIPLIRLVRIDLKTVLFLNYFKENKTTKSKETNLHSLIQTHICSHFYNQFGKTQNHMKKSSQLDAKHSHIC